MDIKAWYSSYFAHGDGSVSSDGKQWNLRCPFHTDTKPSFSISLETGAWKCHVPSCPQHAGGGLAEFYALKEGGSIEDARQQLPEELAGAARGDKKKKRGRPAHDDPGNCPVSYLEILTHHQTLLGNPTALKSFQDVTGYTLDTIMRFNLGWNGNAFTFPILEGETVMNLRFYRPHGDPKYSGIPGFNSAVLWPMKSFEQSTVYLMEGEKDCVLAHQIGLNAITVTGGAGTWKSEWNEYFRDKNVVICYDIDKAGREGARKVVNELTGYVKELKDILLPITEPPNGDFTDYIHQGYTLEQFLTLVETAKLLKFTPPCLVEIPDEVYDSDLYNASYKHELFYRRVRMKVRVIGKDLSPYIIPRHVRVTCRMNNGRKCDHCVLKKFNGTHDLVIDEKKPDLLGLLGCEQSKQLSAVRDIVGIAEGCTRNDIFFEGAQYVEEMKVIPMINHQNEGRYVMRSVFALNKHMSVNADYDILAVTAPNSHTQEAVHLIYDTEPMESSLDNFILTPEIIKQLLVFQCL